MIVFYLYGLFFTSTVAPSIGLLLANISSHTIGTIPLLVPYPTTEYDFPEPVWPFYDYYQYFNIIISRINI